MNTEPSSVQPASQSSSVTGQHLPASKERQSNNDKSLQAQREEQQAKQGKLSFNAEGDVKPTREEDALRQETEEQQEQQADQHLNVQQTINEAIESQHPPSPASASRSDMDSSQIHSISQPQAGITAPQQQQQQQQSHPLKQFDISEQFGEQHAQQPQPSHQPLQKEYPQHIAKQEDVRLRDDTAQKLQHSGQTEASQSQSSIRPKPGSRDVIPEQSTQSTAAHHGAQDTRAGASGSDTLGAGSSAVSSSAGAASDVKQRPATWLEDLNERVEDRMIRAHDDLSTRAKEMKGVYRDSKASAEAKLKSLMPEEDKTQPSAAETAKDKLKEGSEFVNSLFS